MLFTCSLCGASVEADTLPRNWAQPTVRLEVPAIEGKAPVDVAVTTTNCRKCRRRRFMEATNLTFRTLDEAVTAAAQQGALHADQT